MCLCVEPDYQKQIDDINESIIKLSSKIDSCNMNIANFNVDIEDINNQIQKLRPKTSFRQLEEENKKSFSLEELVTILLKLKKDMI